MKAAKEILASLGVESIDEMTVNESYSVEVAGYEDLTIEKVGPDRLSVAHHYVQRGDLMCDPEIVFRVEKDEWIPVRYTQHPRVHQHNPAGVDVEDFVTQWSENMREQGFVYATKEEASGWKVYYECNDRCGFEQMAGWVKLSDIEHRDEVDERAREMGERWAGP